MIHVTYVGSHDHQVEDMLRMLGMEVSRATIDGAIAKPGDIVVLDLRGLAALPPNLSLIKRHHPQTAVVVVSSTLDSALLLDAMRAGVNEVLPEPVTTDDLRRVIDRVTGQRIESEPGHVYGFVGAKGGVGTTTVAVNIATVLGMASKPGRALLIDLHRAGGDAATFTGVEPRFSVIDALENMHRLDEVFFGNLVVQAAPHTDLLASPERPAPGEFGRDRVERVIAFASSVYKHTVIDLPRSDAAVLDMLDSLNTIYVVANHELATVKSAARLSTMLRERYGRERVALIVGRSDRHSEIAREDIEKAVGSTVVHTLPSNYRMALQAANKGRPLALDNHNDLSASFKKFASGLAGLHPARNKAASSRLFGRLTRLRS